MGLRLTQLNTKLSEKDKNEGSKAGTRVMATILFGFTILIPSGKASSIAFTQSTIGSWFLAILGDVSETDRISQHPPIYFRIHQKLLLCRRRQPLPSAAACGGVAPHERRHGGSADMCVEEEDQNRHCCYRQRRVSSHFNSHILMNFQSRADTGYFNL